MSAPSPEYGQAPYGQASYNQAPQQPTPKQKNTLGLVALIIAVLGLIFSCVKGALILGWILLPIGFILGLIAAIGRDKPKGKAIAAIIVSIVGSFVAAIFFLFVIAEAADEAFNGDTTASLPEDSASADDNADSGNSNDGEAGTTRDNPLPIGTTIESDDWSLTINSVDLNGTDAVLAENPFNDAPGEGETYAIVNITSTYKGNDEQGRSPFPSISYVTPEGTSISSHDHMAVVPNNFDFGSPLYEGASAEGNVALLIPADTASEGVLAVSPDMLSKDSFVAVQ